MTFDETYSQLYDSFYEEKDYPGEARFVLSRIETLLGTSRRFDILDLGCGTARHAAHFAEHGHRVDGVERSTRMLEIARLGLTARGSPIADRVSVREGDIRYASLGLTYDAICCLFHVINYMQRDEDVRAAFVNARRHARDGTAYLFDFWHGPAVLRHPPVLREKTITTGTSTVRRVSTPIWDRARSLVRVNYRLEITDLLTGRMSTEHECHILRYFFPEQIETWLKASGFLAVEVAEWMTAKPPRDDCFSVYMLARAV